MNKWKSLWVSASSSSNFTNCPRAWYFSSIYKDSENCKIATVSPYLALGQAVHNPLEMLAHFPPSERKDIKLAPEFNRTWKEFEGEKGGFTSKEMEDDFRSRGIDMVKRAKANIHHLSKETTFLTENEALPNIVLSEKDEVILSGKIDWISVLGKNAYDVIDYKTGKEQADSSLQLPIYKILLNAYKNSGEDVTARFWYLSKNDDPTPIKLPALKDCIDMVMETALKMKATKAKGIFECPRGEEGCFACKAYIRIINNDRVKYISKGIYGAKNYMIL